MIHRRIGKLKAAKSKRRRSKVDNRELRLRKTFLPYSVRVSKLAEVMAEVQIVLNDMLPFRASPDIGTDIITQYFGVLKRVQVKGQEKSPKSEDTFTFSTRRTDKTGQTAYRLDELDAFIFVHTEQRRFFVVPAYVIGSDRYTITFGPNSHSEWEDAWWVLQKE